jgi:hypothetical protein
MTDEEKSKQSKGGKKRAQGMTPKQLSDSGRKAALTRWANEGKVAVAHYGSPDRPLRIGDIDIPCYVLADGRRVLAQRGLQGGMGLSEGGGKGGARKIVQFMEYLERKGLDTKGLSARANSPISFIPPHGGNPADGYEATILPDICAVVIEASQKGLLHERQKPMATRCAELQHGFARDGIIALVDIATGYRDAKIRDNIAHNIDRHVAKELRPWVRTFQPEYYKQIHRLNGWLYTENGGSPGVVGTWTTDIVYKRFPLGVWEEINKLAARNEKGRLKHRLFQRLSYENGHPLLKERLAAIIQIMKWCPPDWDEFMRRLDQEFPRPGDTMRFPFYDETPALPTPKT